MAKYFWKQYRNSTLTIGDFVLTRLKQYKSFRAEDRFSSACFRLFPLISVYFRVVTLSHGAIELTKKGCVGCFTWRVWDVGV